MIRIYLDDVRTPYEQDWIVVRDFDQFVDALNKHGLDNITYISLDHDLGDDAMSEYYTNVKHNKTLDYNNIHEKTGMDCCKFLVNKCIDEDTNLPQVYVHSANPIGSDNMISYINNFLKSRDLPQTCKKIEIPHSVHPSHLVSLKERLRRWDKTFNEEDDEGRNN